MRVKLLDYGVPSEMQPILSHGVRKEERLRREPVEGIFVQPAAVSGLIPLVADNDHLPHRLP